MRVDSCPCPNYFPSNTAPSHDDSDGLTSLDLLPSINWDATIEKEWSPGEDGAADNLADFIENSARKYKDGRDIPSANGTSRLSPHLHFGEVSPNQVWYAIKDKFGNSEDKSIETYLSELGWREFSYYLLFHFVL